MHDGDRTWRYMERFHCIGSDCEDNCCHDWRVVVDGDTVERLNAVATLHSKEERERWQHALVTEDRGPKQAKLYSIRLKPDGNCPMLLPNGWCHVQATFGEKFLPDVCATYPRGLQWIVDDLELAGTTSCPEVARQLLLHADAVDEVALDRDRLPRIKLAGGHDPRDVRPYWRLMLEVRAFMLALLKRREYTLEQRLFFMCWFAKRTQSVLNRSVMKGDVELVRQELALLDDAKTREQIRARFDRIEAPSSLALLFARQLVVQTKTNRRQQFEALVSSIFASYTGARELVEEGAKRPTITVDEFHAEYKRRKRAIVERSGARTDQFLAHAAFNYWVHHLPMEAPDLLTYLLRMLALLAVHKFLIFSHPSLQAPLDDESFLRALDAAAVEVVYKTSRHIEHSPLMQMLEVALASQELASFAGAVYLVRF